MLFPSVTGEIGINIAKFFNHTLRLSTYVFITIITLWSIRILLKRYPIPIFRDITGHILFIISISIFLELISKFINQHLSGIFGLFLADQSIYLFGIPGSYVLVTLLFLIALTLSTKFSVPEIVTGLINRIVEDIEEWQRIKKQKPKIKNNFPIAQIPKLKKPTITVLEPEPVKIKTAPAPSQPDTKTTKPVDNIIENVKDKKDVKREPKTKYDTTDPQTQNKKPQSQLESYTLPTIDLLEDYENTQLKIREENVESRAQFLIQTLQNFGIETRVVEINPGPVVTRYDLQPAPGVKIQSIVSLSNDIALAMQAQSIHVIAPIPGKAAVGIEIPNQKAQVVGIREIILSSKFQQSLSKLTFVLGKTTSGESFIADIAPMPHLLIAGSTGSGKSVCLHTIISSILFRARPDEVKLLLIDPKRLELPVYDNIPHLYDPNQPCDNVKVVTNSKEATKSLEKLIKVMDLRYKKFAAASVRNIEGYNVYAEKNGLEKEFYIVVIIDELADLILVAQKEVEEFILRLAQMARAVGIHLILATQRPSVDVITGVIKANLPSRIAFQVLSKTDSRVILDCQGAEDLLGRGDMLFLPSGAPKPTRLQGAFVSEQEVERIANFVRAQSKPCYPDIFGHIEQQIREEQNEEMQELMLHALRLMQRLQRVSSDIVRGDERIGHKYGLVLAQLEKDNFIYKPEGTKSWKIDIEKVNEHLDKLGE